MPNNVRLEAVIHGEVRVRPVADELQADEILPLAVDLLARVIATLTTECRCIHFLPNLADLFLNVELNRQAMTVPTRNIRRVKAAEGLALDDNILEDLVDRMTDMNLAIGIRGAIVQDELRPVLTQLA